MRWGERLKKHRVFLAAWTVAVATGASAMWVASFAYAHLPRPEPMEELSYYPSGEHLKWFTFGHEESAADLAWLRAVQYYGEHRATDNRFDKMQHVFEVLTSLAPRFLPAYVFGSFALAQEGRDFAAAEQLMLKGIEANPRSGTLAFELGFLYYVRPGGRSLEKAAEYFQQAARQPDAPGQASRFAAYARQHSGNLRLAYELWDEVYRNSPNHFLRETAKREMEKIVAAIREDQSDIAIRTLTTPQVLIGVP